MTGSYRIPKATAARELLPTPQLSDQFRLPQHRSRPDEDRSSRDNPPGDQVQPELQQQHQQHAMGPTAMQYEQGAPAQTWPGFHHPPQYNPQQQWQQQQQMMMQQQMMQQQQQQQTWPSGWEVRGMGPYPGNFGFGPQLGGPPRPQQQQQRLTQQQQQQQLPQQQQRQQQAEAGDAAPSTSEGPVYPPASSRRPRSRVQCSRVDF